MSTPEGAVKNMIDQCLANHGIYNASKAGSFPENANGWYYKPAQSSFGVSGIPDFLGNYKGFFWAIEAKAPGKKPTGFQKLQLAAINGAGSVAFVVDGEESLKEFKRWAKSMYDEAEGRLFW